MNETPGAVDAILANATTTPPLEDLRGHQFVPLAELARPRTGECVVGHWWVTHPALGAVFVGGYPQCNRDQAIAEAVGAKLYPGWPVVQVGVAYLGVGPRR